MQILGSLGVAFFVLGIGGVKKRLKNRITSKENSLID